MYSRGERLQKVVDQDTGPDYGLQNSAYDVPEPVNLIDEIYCSTKKGYEQRKSHSAIFFVHFDNVVFISCHILI